jgi:preprotein translocase subunit SecY
VWLQTNVLLIVLFNYYYTFLQLDPKDMSEQLKRAGASIPAVRPGRATADYITKTLNRMSILGSAFLGALAAAPPLVEAVTGLQVVPTSSFCLWLVGHLWRSRGLWVKPPPILL